MPDEHHFKFTQAAVEAVKPPDQGRAIYWDSLLPGFGLRVSAPRACSGYVHKVYLAVYRVSGISAYETERAS